MRSKRTKVKPELVAAEREKAVEGNLAMLNLAHHNMENMVEMLSVLRTRTPYERVAFDPSPWRERYSKMDSRMVVAENKALKESVEKEQYAMAMFARAIVKAGIVETGEKKENGS